MPPQGRPVRGQGSGVALGDPHRPVADVACDAMHARAQPLDGQVGGQQRTVLAKQIDIALLDGELLGAVAIDQAVGGG